MFVKLALRNAKRQAGNYLIYFVTVALTIALMFAMNNMMYSEQIQKAADDDQSLASGIIVATVFVAVATAFVLGYATSFMMKLRRKEFGMYLTLGMTRKNILTLFSLENSFLYIAALSTGLAAGLLLYQGLMVLVSKLLEIDITFSRYSATGLKLTVILGIGVFVLAVITSIRFLNKVSISELLQYEHQEKTERRPLFWFVISLVSLTGLIATIVKEFKAINLIISGASKGVEIILWVPVLAIFVFFFHMSCARGLMGFLLRSKSLCSKGTNCFLLRQLSGKMTVNSVMIGVLSVLFFFAVMLSNISFASRIGNEEMLEREMPFDCIACFSLREQPAIPLEQAIPIIEKYTGIREQQPYSLWTNDESVVGPLFFNQTGETKGDSYMPLSEFNKVATMDGREPLTLQDEYVIMVVGGKWFMKESQPEKAPLTLNGKEYAYREMKTDYPFYSYEMCYIVIPDEALAGMRQVMQYVAMSFDKKKFDVTSLLEELRYQHVTENATYMDSDYDFQEWLRLFNNANIGIIIVCLLYISTVFVCMALAILSLKTLSGLREDERRYDVLNRLGADRKMKCKALFHQVFAFFVLPFAIPLLMSVPLAFFCGQMTTNQGMPELASESYLNSAVIAATLTLIYGLYFMITYLNARRAVIR